MDPNLHLALLAATHTRRDLDALVEADAGLADQPLGDKLVGVTVGWTMDRSRHAYDELSGPDLEAAKIRSLIGIDRFAAGLLILDLGESVVDDLRPLLALPGLESLRLGVTPSADLGPLLELPALARVAIDGEQGEMARKVLAQLADKGVLVDSWKGPDAAPFEDDNLKLAVVTHVHRDALPRSFPQFDEYRLDRANLARVLALPITDADLAAIECLEWNIGGHSVHHLVYEQWDGEGDTFSIRTLAGIEHLPNLRVFAAYSDEIAAPELDALVARDVLVFERPSAPSMAEAPSALDPGLLAALQFATHGQGDFPRNFASWTPERRRAYLAALALGTKVRLRDGELLVRWSLDDTDGEFPTAPARLVSESPDAPLLVRDLRGIEPYGNSIKVLDLPLSEVDDLGPLAKFTRLRELVVRVTNGADLGALRKLKKLAKVTVSGAVDGEGQAVLAELRRRKIEVRVGGAMRSSSLRR